MGRALTLFLDRVPKGYGGLAWCGPAGDAEPDAGKALDNLEASGFPVLPECSGALGVLRDLDIPGKLGPGLLRSLSDSGREVEILHLREDPGPAGVRLDYYRVIVFQE